MKDEVFTILQRTMCERLKSIFSRPDSALETISQFSMESDAYGIMSTMLKASIPLSEPFLHSALHLFQCSKVKEVKLKARILIPKSAQLMGVLDELSVLQYGQLYVQFTDWNDPSGRTRTVLKGRVLLAKMPVLHPGDIRLLECVDLPQLSHHFDVIVFPQLGCRPHPSVPHQSSNCCFI